MSHPSLPNSHVWVLSVTTSHSYSVYTTPSSLPPSKAASCLAFLSLPFSWTTLSQLHTAYTQQGAALWQSAAPLTSREWNVAPVHKCPHLRWSPCSSYKQSTLGDTCIHQPPTDRKGNSSGGPKPSSRCSSCFPLRLMCSFTSLRQVAVFHCRVLSVLLSFLNPIHSALFAELQNKHINTLSKARVPGTSAIFGSCSTIKNSWWSATD